MGSIESATGTPRAKQVWNWRGGLTAVAISAGIGLVSTSAVYAASALSDKPKPLLSEDELPRRTAPIIEIGPDFLGTGNLPKGWVLPTGAVWQPALWVFGSSRTSYNFVENRRGGEDLSEVATRLDLFANLQLSGTERFLIGFSPFRSSGNFTNYQFSPNAGEGFNDHLSIEPTVAFFEGEFGELFPNLDSEDKGSYDISFAIGRQPIFFQEGALVNDTIDSLGITRDTIIIPDVVIDWRLTGLIGVNDIHRADRRRHDGDLLFGVFNEINFRGPTVNLDAILVTSDDAPGAFAGVAMGQRFGHLNTAVRLNGSLALDEESAAVGDGLLGFVELSTTLPHGEDLVYANGFAAAGDFTPAALDPSVGGPLGRAGVLFASPSLGRYGSALSGATSNVAGGAVGIQLFFNKAKTQLILEAGGRYEFEDGTPNSVAIGAEVRQAIGRRVVLRGDTFYSVSEGRGGDGFGARAEIAINF